MRRVGKILAVGAIAAALACSLGITACSNGENDEEAAGSDESTTENSTYYYEYDEDDVETLYIGEDTVIVPVESEDNPLDSYDGSYDVQFLRLHTEGDVDMINDDYFEITIEDSDGFTISELVDGGESDYWSFDESEDDYVQGHTWSPTIYYDTDGIYYLCISYQYDSDSSTLAPYVPITFTTDDLDYDTVEIGMPQP